MLFQIHSQKGKVCMAKKFFSKQGWFAVLLAAFIAWGGAAAHAQLVLRVPAKTTVKPGEDFILPLTLTNGSSQAISAFGAKLSFPSALLEYDTVSTAGTLTNGWLVVNGNEASPGVVTLGGFHLAPITTSGVLINLKFKAKAGAAGKDSLKLSNLTDGLASASAVNGEVEVFAPGTVFFAVLSGLNEVPPDTNDASGGAMLVLNAEQDALTFDIRVQNLTGPITAAHFHNAPPGVNGGVVRTLTADFQGEAASGDWKSADSEPLTAALVAELLAGRIYVNVHTAANPGGELRGQVLPGKKMTFAAALNGSQEVPVVNTAANGAAVMKLDSVGASLSFDIAANSLSGAIAAAHFHNAGAGTNGSVVRNLTSDFVGTNATGTWKDSDGEALTPGLVAELLAGRLYLNVHTAANPGGEIRGQVFVADSVVFLSVLNGKQEAPSVNTNASGGGGFVLNADRTALAFRVKVGNLGGAITGSHFHKAPAGVNGAIVRPITEFVDTTAVGVWKSTDAQALSLSLVSELLAGNIYVNIHTAANPGGQIRGQVRTGVAISFGAQVNGAQEAPPVNTNAGGFGKFTLNAAGTELTYNIGITGLSGPMTAAHFHNNSVGRNGPVKRTLTSSFTGNFATGVWKSTDVEPLTPALVVELLASNIYFNAHTTANPGGEIRGQVQPGLDPVVPIGVARQLADNTPNVTTEGVVTTVDFQLSSATNTEYYFQDPTGGIRLFIRGKAAYPRGTRIRARNGLLASNSQRKNIETFLDSVAVIDTPGLPPAQLVTVTDYLNNRASIEGELIRINKASLTAGTWPAANANQTVTINDGADLAMFLDRDTDLDGSPQPSNPFDVLGVATSFNGTPQIQPSLRAEFLTPTTFFATLNGAQENPPVNTPATGGGMFVLNPDGTELIYNVSVTGLSGPIQAAHFHNAATGTSGPIVRTITFTGEVASGVWTSTDAQALTPALVAELLAGNIYVNVHTAANPGGEIRGQVLVGTEQQFNAALNGAQEAPPVNTNATGVGSFKLNALGTELNFNVLVAGLSGPIQAAHFHNAARGMNGGVVRAITNDFTGNTATGIWKASDTQALSPALVAELLAGKIYVNVHTAANPNGEIRGQVGSGSEIVFLAALNSSQEVPANNSKATGGGRFVLSADKTQLSYTVRVANLNGPIQAAHFHNAAAGVNGSVVRAIAFTDTSATGVWMSSDAQALTPALVAELLAGNIYVNVHTAANPGGEIRGQVLTGKTFSMSAQINGAQEVPPVATNALGFGAFTLNGDGTELAFQINVAGLSGPIAAAHFHNNAIGRNGPVKRALTNDFTGNNASGIWKSSDAEALTSDLVVELLAGRIYVNVHTAANPGGEIRGQVIPGAKAVMPIALSRQVANGTVVTIEGIVTRAVGRFTRLQDATAGMTIFETSGTFRTAVDSGRVRQGDLLRITGAMAEFSALKEITPIQSFEVISRDNTLPAMQEVTLSEIKANGEKYESELLRVTAMNLIGSTDTVFVAARTYNVIDPSDTSRAVALRTPSASDTRIAGLKIPKKFIFEGVLGQFSSADPAIGYQLHPVNRTDIAIDTKVGEGEAELPETFVLHQNYPNPFNPTTNIRYALPQNVRVKLVIYNLLGEKVRTLVDANESAGAKQVTWDGLNDRGVRAASGVYVYRLEAGTFTATRKLMLMK